MSAPDLIVTGAGGPAGRSLCAQLLERGLRPVGGDMEAVHVEGVETFVLPPANAPEFPAALAQAARDHGVSWVLPTVTEELELLAALDLPGVALTIGAATPVAIAADKWRTAQALAAIGAAPASLLPSMAARPGGAAAIGVPFVSKPRRSRGGRNVTVHRTPGVPAGLDDSFVLQEFVTGAEYAVNLHVPAGDGEPTVVVLAKTALAQGEVGNAVGVRRAEAGDVGAVALAAVRAIGLTGPADVDVRRRADGSPVVLEINARFGAHSAEAPEVLAACLAERGRPALAA